MRTSPAHSFLERTMKKLPHPVALLVLAVVGMPAGAAAQTHGSKALATSSTAALSDTSRVRKWREDLAFIEQQIRTLHPRPFAHCPEAAFDSAARAIEARIPTSDDARLATECMRMVALLHDGHTMLVGTFPPLGFHSVLPVSLRPFADGLYVAAADSAQASLLGARVTKIGDLAADEAIARVASATSGDNQFTELDRVPAFLMMPTLLYSIGVSHDRESVSLELERAGGRRQTVRVNGASAPDGFPQMFLESEPLYPPAWVTARKVSGDKLPLMDQRPGDSWWFTYQPETKIVYLRFRNIDPVTDGIAYPEFYRELFFTVDSLKPRALVIDLRHDHGGNNTILDSFVRGVVERPWLDREGGVFTLIDRGTFSAAMNAAVFLEQQTRTRFIGEPTGGRVSHYGDARHFETPNYHMLFNVSTVPWLARIPGDPREFIAPDIAVPWTFADWRDGKDRALDAATDAAWNGTLAQRVLEAAHRSGPAAGKAAYDAWVKEHPNPWAKDATGQLPAFLSDLGDQQMWRDAETLSEAYTLIAPESATAWRYLGEAQYHLGERDAAIGSCRKAIGLTSFAPMARLLLERMGEKP